MPIDSIESVAKKGVTAVQDYALLAGRAIGNIFQRPHYFADLIVQADSIGIGSLPIVILTGFFTGGVLALQSASSLAQFGATAITGELVSLSMIKELGPVLTSLMVSGRNASGMASELGSMMVTEQIDAMRALGTDPLKKLVTPRLFATVIMLFFLTIISDTVGTWGEPRVGLHARTGRFAVFPYCLPDAALSRYSSGPGQAHRLWLHHCQHRLLLRHEHARRHPGCWPLHHPGGVVSSVLIIFVDFVISQFMIGIFGR
jgi:phospholipid/cholesterol/gamma-HCH transport system permease protein